MELKEQHTSEMGEVRVKVKLTNGGDQMVADSGGLDLAQIRTCEIEGMVDTGAVRSVIPEAVARKLGLPATRMKTVAFADHEHL